MKKRKVQEQVLYHYTSMHHLPRIIESGYLKLTESNLREDIEMHLLSG